MFAAFLPFVAFNNGSPINQIFHLEFICAHFFNISGCIVFLVHFVLNAKEILC